MERSCLQALDTLSTVAPLCLDDYMTCQSNTRLLMLLEWCVGQGEAVSLVPGFTPKCSLYCYHQSMVAVTINQGHPTSIFGKYPFGRRFEI